MPTASGSIAFLGAARFQGFWDASFNLATGSGLDGGVTGPVSGLFTTGSSANGGYAAHTGLTASAGDYWQVTGAGNFNTEGITLWNLNDWCIYSGSSGGTGLWQKLSFQDTIASIVVGDLSSSSFYMGSENNKQIIFASGSVHSGSSAFLFDYDNAKLSGAFDLQFDNLNQKIIWTTANENITANTLGRTLWEVQSSAGLNVINSTGGVYLSGGLGIELSGSSVTASSATGFAVYNPIEGGSAQLQLIADQNDDGTLDAATISVNEHGHLTITGSATINLSAHSVTASVAQGLLIQGEPDGAGAKLFLHADQGDDSADKVTISKGDSSGVLKIQNTAGGVEIENPSASGATALLIDNDDPDEIAFQIDATNTTHDVIYVTAAALTTGNALFINHDDTATTAVTPTSIHLDFDKSGVTADGVTSGYTGVDLDMNDAATNHANATVTMTGLDVDVVSANAQGTLTNTGASITATGADTNVGVEITTTDGAGPDLKIMSSADADDYFSIATTAAGATTLTTVDDGGAEADIIFAPDGIVRVNDDTNLAFGNDEDASIYYNSSNTMLTISGSGNSSTQGIAVSGSQVTIATTLGLALTASAVGTGFDGTLWFGAGGSSRFIKADSETSMLISAPTVQISASSAITASCTPGFAVYNPLEGGSAVISLVADQGDDGDEDRATITKADGGDLTINTGGAEVTINLNDYVKFQQTGVTEFQIDISDAAAGVLFLNRYGESLINMTGSAAHAGLGLGAAAPYSGLTVTKNFSTIPFETQLPQGHSTGKRLRFSPATTPTMVTGALYYLATGSANGAGGHWNYTDANVLESGSANLLGIAAGTSATSTGLTLNGYVRVPTDLVEGTFVTGAALYVSEEPGHVDFTAPSSSGEYVRIVGYALDWTSGGDILIYFNPDSTWVEIS